MVNCCGPSLYDCDSGNVESGVATWGFYCLDGCGRNWMASRPMNKESGVNTKKRLPLKGNVGASAPDSSKTIT